MNADPVMTGSYASWDQKRAATPRNPTGDLSLRLDQAWRILNMNQDLIRSADQKIYLLIVMSILLVSCVAANIEKISRIGPLQYGLLAVFILACGAFYFFALSTLFPRKNQVAAQENVGLIFFGDVARRLTVENYIEDIGNVPLAPVRRPGPTNLPCVSSRDQYVQSVWPSLAGNADKGQLVHRSRSEHGAGQGLGRLPWR